MDNPKLMYDRAKEVCGIFDFECVENTNWLPPRKSEMMK